MLNNPDDELTRYLIIGRARSGTTMIHLTLMGHPNVAALNDELKPEPLLTKGISSFTFGNDTAEEKSMGSEALFDAITAITRKNETRANGAKTVINSAVVASRVVSHLQEYMPRLKIIHVVREDLVALYGSAQQGRKSGVMHSWNTGFSEREIDKTRVSKYKFTHFALGCLETRAVVGRLEDSHDYLEVAYEEYLRQPRVIEQQLMEFLNLPHVPVTWLNSEKVLPPASEYIVNCEQLTTLNLELVQQVEDGRVSQKFRQFARAGAVLNRLSWK